MSNLNDLAVAFYKGKASGKVEQVVPDMSEKQNLITAFGNFEGVMEGDFITRTRYSNGQIVTALSAGPLYPGESSFILDTPIEQPCAMEVEASVVRNRQQFATITLFSNGATDTPAPVPDPINIVSISQSSAALGAAYTGTAGTVVTLTLETPVPDPAASPAGVYLSDWIHVKGLTDTRLNYQNAAISYISQDRKTLTFGFSDEIALPSLAIPVVTPALGTAKVYFYNNMGGASEGFGTRFTGTTPTQATLVSVSERGDAQVSGVLLGDHRATVATTAPQYLNGLMGNVELKASSRYRFESRAGECSFLDKTIEGLAATFNGRASRTSVKPTYQHKLRPRFRIYQPVGFSKPVAKITEISKSGTTTATVTHNGGYTFEVGNVVGIYGVRDITNFAQSTGTITAVLSPTQFQLVLGSAVTATSYGGTVSIINGGAAQPGVIAQNIQSVRQVPDQGDWLEFIGNTTWAGVSVGDYINVHGVMSSGGVDFAVDGAWEVAHLSTTTMYVKPVVDVYGKRVSPVTPSIGIAVVACGGTVILRSTLRIHDIMLESWSDNRVSIDGQGTARVDRALPVIPITTTTVASSISNDLAIGTSGAGYPTMYRAQTSNPSAVSATGDAVLGLGTMIGVGITKPYAIPEAGWNASLALTTTTAAAIQAAGGAGLKKHMTALQAINTGASAVDLIILDGTTERWRLPLPVNVPVAFEFPTEITTTANTALNANLSAAGTVRANFQGYTAP